MVRFWIGQDRLVVVAATDVATWVQAAKGGDDAFKRNFDSPGDHQQPQYIRELCIQLLRLVYHRNG